MIIYIITKGDKRSIKIEGREQHRTAVHANESVSCKGEWFS